MLRAYVRVKPQVKIDKTFWFPQEYEPISRDDIALFGVANTLALRGEGTGQLPRINYLWHEERLIQTLDQMVDDIRKVSDAKTREDLLGGTMEAYDRLLYGDYARDKHGRENIKQKGIFELQDFRSFEILLKQFFALSDLIDKGNQNQINMYLNGLYFVGIIVLDGFGEKLIAEASKAIFDIDGNLIDEDTLFRKNLPQFTHEIVQDYWYRLSAEQVIEGRMITPISYVSHAIAQKLTLEETNKVTTFFKKILEQIGFLLPQLASREITPSVQIVFAWIKRAYYRKRLPLAEELIEILKNNRVVLALTELTAERLNEFNFVSELNDIVLVALTNRHKEVFEYVSKLLIVVYNIYFSNDIPNTTIPLLRSLARIGSLAFAYSELDQDTSWVETYTQTLFSVLTNKAPVIDALNTVTKGTHNYWNANFATDQYFHQWFVKFEAELETLPVEYRERMYGVADDPHFVHASAFISSFSADEYRLYFTEDKCVKGYIEWLKANHLPTTSNPAS